jgi:dihydrofolate reductase
MRRIVGGAFVSLDGVMQAPGGPTEDWTGGFRFGGWVAPHFDEKVGQAISGLFDGEFDLLLGRKTYEIFAAHWPYAPEGDPIGTAFDKAAKYVVTRGDDDLPWQNSHRLASVDAIRELKTSAGPDLVIQGSTTLYPQLFAAGLIDRFMLLTFPVVLGTGKRIFGEGMPALTMKLVSSETSPSGVTLTTYEPAGDVAVGTFQQDEPSAREVARQARMKAEG